jgi:hypothetical protein
MDQQTGYVQLWDYDAHGAKDYDSNWEWTKARSNYHFDKWREDQENEWFRVLGRFEGDWSQDLAEAEAELKPITWRTRKFFGSKSDATSPMIEQEENDLLKAGATPDLELTDVHDNPAKFMSFARMIRFLQLETGYKARIHWQRTGQMFNTHIDKLYDVNPDDPSKVVRITIMLTDWEPGQFYMYGNRIYDRWRAGDMHIFDWPNTPHATANASHHPRPTLQITGTSSESTRMWLKFANKDNRYKLGDRV